MIITISGTAGSGKSTIAKLLASKLNLKHYSVGDFRREMAKRLGISINELNKRGESEEFTDKEPDEWQEKLGKTEDNFIIDGRLSFHFIPNSFKLFIDADITTRAERIYNDKRDSEKFSSFDNALQKVNARQDSDTKRYQKYYNINPFTKEHYDLVVDTTNNNPDECVEIILEKLNI
jgi:CMP/dCMP kinase